jgi:hypothetical protein
MSGGPRWSATQTIVGLLAPMPHRRVVGWQSLSLHASTMGETLTSAPSLPVPRDRHETPPAPHRTGYSCEQVVPGWPVLTAGGSLYQVRPSCAGGHSLQPSGGLGSGT